MQLVIVYRLLFPTLWRPICVSVALAVSVRYGPICRSIDLPGAYVFFVLGPFCLLFVEDTPLKICCFTWDA